MGTNYYLSTGICACCKKPDIIRHIGKSSGGWCFSLHVIPDEGINNLNDWISLWAQENSEIKNEYGDSVSKEDMLKEITERGGKPKGDWHHTFPFGTVQSWDEFHRQNYSEFGSNNLLRHKVDNIHCIGHGEGTWDHIIGEFS